MPGGRPTIVDVAGAAGVSRTTASDALNGHGRVAEQTRARVLHAAQSLGYQADVSARSLRRRRTSTLALFLPSESSPAGPDAAMLQYHLRLANAAALAAFTRGHALLLMPPLPSPEEYAGVAFDGAIVVDPAADARQRELLARWRLPAVTIEPDLSDPERQAERAVEMLIAALGDGAREGRRKLVVRARGSKRPTPRLRTPPARS